MDKAKQSLDDYTEKTSTMTNYVAFDLLDNNTKNQAEDLLTLGEKVLDHAEK